MKKSFYIFSSVIASAFWIGYTPKISGTAGSLIGLILIYFMPPGVFLSAVIIFGACIILTPIVYSAEKYYGVYDDGRIVADEVVGCMIACLALPKHPLLLVCAFVLFRFFDILKPGIIKSSQDLPYGIGVMADDIISGICANVSVQLFYYGYKLLV